MAKDTKNMTELISKCREDL